MARRSARSKTTGGSEQSRRLHELEVTLLSGPITEAFAKRNRCTSRTIQIRGDQTLEDLHEAVFEAFDRFDEHMYEFQLGGRRPMDPEARRYVLSMAMNDPFDDRQPAGDVQRTTIESLGLKVEEPFVYWFDFGDDWWHQITVIAIHDEVPRGRFPKVVQRTGESPPQYIDWDEQDDADD